jgi:hypothetical protein
MIVIEELTDEVIEKIDNEEMSEGVVKGLATILVLLAGEMNFSPKRFNQKSRENYIDGVVDIFKNI